MLLKQHRLAKFLPRIQLTLGIVRLQHFKQTGESSEEFINAPGPDSVFIYSKSLVSRQIDKHTSLLDLRSTATILENKKENVFFFSSLPF